MKYFEYPYVNNYESDIKIGLIHYILIQNASNGQTFIPAKFVQPFFREEKYNLKDLYQILYDHNFIKRVITKQGTFGLDYYKVTFNDCALLSTDLPILLKSKYLTYIHKLDSNENLKFQNVLNYTIDIDIETLDIELNKWKEKKLTEFGIEKDITTEELWTKIQTHNDNVNNDIKFWTKDDYSGRRHHLLSYSPSFLRNYTNHGFLVEIDVVQCQPVLLAFLEEKYDEVGNDYSKLFYDENFDVYNYLSEDRNKGKDIFYKMFFGYYDNEHQFKKQFPNYSIRVNKIKREDPTLIGIQKNDKRLAIDSENKRAKWIKNNFKYYKAMSLACQLLEVEIFEQIWKELIKQKLLFIPVHDGIYCKEENVPEIKKIIETVFKNEFKESKIKVKLKIK